MHELILGEKNKAGSFQEHYVYFCAATRFPKVTGTQATVPNHPQLPQPDQWNGHGLAWTQ